MRIGTYSFSGSAVANVLLVSGIVQGNSFSLFGYFDKTGTYTGVANSIAVFDYHTLQYVGLLVAQTATLPPISVSFAFVPPTTMITSAAKSLTAVVANDTSD